MIARNETHEKILEKIGNSQSLLMVKDLKNVFVKLNVSQNNATINPQGFL